MQIGAQRSRTVIPHLKPILNISKLKFEELIKMKWYIFLDCSTVAANCNTETQIQGDSGSTILLGQYVATVAAHQPGNSPNLSQPNQGTRPPESPCRDEKRDG